LNDNYKDVLFYHNFVEEKLQTSSEK